MKSFREFLNEVAAERETVIKNGRPVSKLTPPPGHKMQGTKCMNVSATDVNKKQRASVKGAQTRKAASKSIARKRERSLEKRKDLGL